MKPAWLLLLPLMLLACNNDNETEVDETQNAPPDASMFSTYRNNTAGFSFPYPTGWDTTLLSAQMIFTARAQEDTSDDFRENLNIYTVSVAHDATLDMVLKSASTGFLNQYQSGIILENGLFKNANGLDYAMLRTLIHRKKTGIISTNVYFKKEDKIFVLTMGTDNRDSSQFNSVYRQVVDGYKFDTILP